MSFNPFTSRWLRLVRPKPEVEVHDELAFHLDERAREYESRGMTPEDARAAALSRLGDLEAIRRECTSLLSAERRSEERQERLSMSWLDFKLGLRMLSKHPGLTVVAVLAMTFGIAFGAGGFELVKDQLYPPLPYRDSGRIVRIQNVSAVTLRPDERALYDFSRWRGELRTVDHLSALSERDRSLSLRNADGAAAPVAETAVSAAAFELVAPPLLGRPLLPADELPGAPAVAVLAHDLWQHRFRGNRDVVGRLVWLGGAPTTVVGVMPEHFAFFLPRDQATSSIPYSADLWVPFRANPLDQAPGSGPAIAVFGRLAPGASPEAARAELAALGTRAAEERPDTHLRLKPELLTFAPPLASVKGLATTGIIAIAALFLGALMVVLCANVALLLFARAATREGEMAVRSALGASRGRIVLQLFAEALVLAAVALASGLLVASVGLKWVVGVMRSMLAAGGEKLPSWIGDTLSPVTIGYAVGLVVLGAVVAGVLPGLKATGRRPHAGLQRLAGRGSGVRLGGIWTAIVVLQVALTAMLVPVTVLFGVQTWKLRTADSALPAGEYVSVRMELNGEVGSQARATAVQEGDATRFQRAYRALKARVATEPGVVDVTVASHVPGSWHGRRRVELEAGAGAAAAAGTQRAQIASVAPDFFEAMGAPIVAGSSFAAGEPRGGAQAVVVNESFVREFLGGRNAIGQRLRYGGGVEPAPWYEIVGVVRDLAMSIDPILPHNGGIYHPLLTGEQASLQMAVRITGPPAAFAGRLHELAAAVAPELRLGRPISMSESGRGLFLAYDTWFRILVLGGLLGILLTHAGIYAVLAFTVARRTREIGVRIALGADGRQIAAAILTRTLRQVAGGAVLGAWLGLLLTFMISEGFSEGAWQPTALQSGGIVVAYIGLVVGVCMIACVVPLRRALRIEPTEALASE